MSDKIYYIICHLVKESRRFEGDLRESMMQVHSAIKANSTSLQLWDQIGDSKSSMMFTTLVKTSKTASQLYKAITGRDERTWGADRDELKGSALVHYDRLVIVEWGGDCAYNAPDIVHNWLKKNAV